MNINEAVGFIESADWKGSVLGLSRMEKLLSLLGDPHKGMKFIHVAGTNGKGSVCAMLSAVLTAAGYRTGMYSSPHLVSYRERMRFNEEDISEEDFCLIAEKVKKVCGSMDFDETPTVFEIVTAMAFCYFAEKKCDIVVLEVGLGGRLDATNVIENPVLSVICALDLEHTEVLGNTIEEIAYEKGGIIKPHRPAVLYSQGEKAAGVIKDICEERGCVLKITEPGKARQVYAGLDFQSVDYKKRKGVRTNLIGTYQTYNLLTVLDCVDLLKEEGFDISEDALAAGLSRVRWRARFECIKKDPVVILDGAHNPNGAAFLARCLSDYLPGEKFTFVCGVMADKDLDGMLSETVPFANRFITVRPDHKRALGALELKKSISERYNLEAICAGSVREGLDLAMKYRAGGENICVFGSLYQAGDVLGYFGIKP